ncbi:hypothetical protein [Leptospira yasudae]|uniref:hypothetical protein n=1 Tax=Leptospira yasudae TaxID=2202201 RepID=UPI001090D209|nr:hypothetical protein [Leptospira yasudae]TGM97921.1 hypothetical protein EHR10_13600 [Leptospira yasudae]
MIFLHPKNLLKKIFINVILCSLLVTCNKKEEDKLLPLALFLSSITCQYSSSGIDLIAISTTVSSSPSKFPINFFLNSTPTRSIYLAAIQIPFAKANDIVTISGGYITFPSGFPYTGNNIFKGGCPINAKSIQSIYGLEFSLINWTMNSNISTIKFNTAGSYTILVAVPAYGPPYYSSPNAQFQIE